MKSIRPIARRNLPDTMSVREPLPDGGFGEPRLICNVCFQRTQKAVADEHRSADAGCGTIFVDAVNSSGAFEVVPGSRVTLNGRSPSLYVVETRTCSELFGRVHHWELKVR